MLALRMDPTTVLVVVSGLRRDGADINDCGLRVTREAQLRANVMLALSSFELRRPVCQADVLYTTLSRAVALVIV